MYIQRHQNEMTFFRMGYASTAAFCIWKSSNTMCVSLLFPAQSLAGSESATLQTYPTIPYPGIGKSNLSRDVNSGLGARHPPGTQLRGGGGKWDSQNPRGFGGLFTGMMCGSK